MENTYPKKEKLCSKNIIDGFFHKNKPIYDFPLKIFWQISELPADVPCQSIVTVSKRRFKRAVIRNLLKRRMREAFRLNKAELYMKLNKTNIQIALMIIYNHSEIHSFKTIETAMIKCFAKLNKLIESECLNRQNSGSGKN